MQSAVTLKMVHSFGKPYTIFKNGHYCFNLFFTLTLTFRRFRFLFKSWKQFNGNSLFKMAPISRDGLSKQQKCNSYANSRLIKTSLLLCKVQASTYSDSSCLRPRNEFRFAVLSISLFNNQSHTTMLSNGTGNWLWMPWGKNLGTGIYSIAKFLLV